ncbi:hypothetical protein SteCoe_30556 [Stentor coeruleus]|uniref:Mitochondrial import inner membrane translocase subunit TIM50 n=1 Tax=Stentor coeruleus TaxID=5963 RepID=A0A1R2B3C1_9CILI|nr:hypothetical protein SteCoe_30556 [Stentor coeruleus]
MVSRNARLAQSSRSFKISKNSSEFLDSLALMQSTLESIDADSILKYIEHVSFINTIKAMSKDLEACYVITISSLIVYDYNKPYAFDSEHLNFILKSAISLSEALSVAYSKKESKMNISPKVRNLSFALLSSVRDLISSTKATYKPTIDLKIKLLSKILSLAATTPFTLLMVSLVNLIKSRVTSNVYPCFTNACSPFLPEYDRKQYTLVLDLDETLVHTKENKLLIRPGACEFIEQMSLHYELVLFTASTPVYADIIMAKIDPNNYVKLRLYRGHTTGSDVPIKNLETLGRDLSKIIIVDNLKESFKLQENNGICISTWTGDDSDFELMKVAALLQKIPYMGITHVSEVLLH